MVEKMNAFSMNSMRRWIAVSPSCKTIAAMTATVAATVSLSGCDSASTSTADKPNQPVVSAELDNKPSDSVTTGAAAVLADQSLAKKDNAPSSASTAENPTSTSDKKTGLDYTALTIPKEGSEAKDWIAHLSMIDKSMRELMRAVGSPDLPQEEALRQARQLSDMKLAASEGLAAVATAPKEAELAIVAKLEALAHAAGLGDAAAGSKLRVLATQKKEIQNPTLAHQANVVLLGFSLSDIMAGLTDSTAVVAQLDQMLNTTEPLQQPDMRISLQTLKVLDQQSQTAAFATAKEKIIVAFRDNADPSMAMQAWSLDVNDSEEMKLLNESLGNPEIPGERVKSTLDAMVKRSPTQWTIAWLLSNVSNIEYTGNLEHASAVMATIEENFALLKAPQLIAEAKPVIEGFKKRIALIGQPLDFSGQKVLLTGKEFEASAIAGKITLVDFWATWCGPCRAEFPNLRELYKKYQDKGFEIIGVNLDDAEDDVSTFLVKESLPWIHLRSMDKSLEGFANPLSQKLSITAIPFMLLLDREGKVVHIHARGKRLEELLAAYFEK